MTEQLKPCPFCGGEASQVKHSSRFRYPFFVVCRGCGAQSQGTAFKNDEFNAKEWNTRAIPPTHRVVSVPFLQDLLVVAYQADFPEVCEQIRAIIDNKGE